MATNQYSYKVASGAFWITAQNLVSQFISFFVTLVMSRLLSPDDYGTVAIVLIFIGIGGVLADSGFGKALVQSHQIDQIGFSTAFYFSLFLGVIIYGILFFIAPFVADFFSKPELTVILRVLSLVIVFNCIESVQNAVLQRNFLFKKDFKISLISLIVGVTTGVTLAIKGYGCWALVWNQIFARATSIVAKWFLIRWRPTWEFSFTALMRFWSFGWKLTVSSLLAKIYDELSSVLVGKFYTSADLAFINKGRTIPNMVLGTFDGAIGRASFPALAQMQDDLPRFKNSMRKMIQTSTYLVFPAMAFLAVSSKDIIYILWGDQWDSASPYFQISCLGFALWPLHTINLQAITALGRSDVFLKLEIAKKILGLVLLGLALPHGVLQMVLATVAIGGPISVFINSFPNKKLIGYSLLEQIKDIIKPALLSVCSCFFIWVLTKCFIPVYGGEGRSIFYALSTVVSQLFIGSIFYLAGSYVLRIKALGDMMLIFRNFIGKRHG